MIIIEATMMVCLIIILINISIFIGREFGTFEKFILVYLKKLRKKRNE